MKCQSNLKQIGIALHSFHDVNNKFPEGGKFGVYTNGVTNQDWGSNQGTWLVFILPYIEQDNMYRVLNPRDNVHNSVGITQSAATKISIYRCPSDDYEINGSFTNYAGSLGPQCLPGPCGYDPFAGWCQPENSGLGGGVAGMGYTWSPDHGNTVSSRDLRGVFNRLGATVSMGGIKDGTSNTILVGEILPAQHDHHGNTSWANFNGGASHHGTLPPINYRSHTTAWCSPATTAHHNWSVSWGFKSNHAQGANFLFGDGSVKMLNQSIDHRTYQLLGARDDGIPVPGNY
jgi:prepilin-type processing-associated H-X9-DG protein